MSEEEAEYEEEYEEEPTEPVDLPPPATELKRSHRPRSTASIGRDRLETLSDEASLTEAEKAMIAAKRRQEEESVIKLQDYEERRRVEREREEEELRVLKEKQELRRVQREEEERAEAERRRNDEERRQQEESERRTRMENERRKKTEEKERKRQQMLNITSGGAGGGTGGRNFILPEKKKDNSDKFGNIVQAKHEMGLTREQRETAKNAFLVQIERMLGDMSLLSGHDLRGKIKDMHQRICKLETEKYDLEKRVQSQEYDLRELNERQRQFHRQSAVKNNRGGIVDDTNGRYPPKIAVISKYDRQIDRRNFVERRHVFDKKHAFPCFPNIGPPPTILEFRVKPEGAGVDGPGAEEEYEEEEEEE